jgi:DNA gyrase subunit A
MRRSYLDYSMSVIIGRALPDARDGLKPVHRRVLYTMSEMGLQHNKKYTKCAKVVGQCMGVYHPHGDSAIYDTLVRMAQPFRCAIRWSMGRATSARWMAIRPRPCVTPSAAWSASPARCWPTSRWRPSTSTPNYDESTFEPTVLPTRIPNLIVNGSSGIAVGMATNIPPHNLTEVVNATIALVKNPNAGLAEVLKHVQGPDFPTGGFLYGKSGIPAGLQDRPRPLPDARQGGLENLTKEKQAIIVTEIPYQVNKSKLIERIAELVNDKIVDDISDVRDESDRDGMRIVIELKRGAQPEIVLNQLYKHTQMQESFSMIFLAVLNGQPRELGSTRPSAASSITASTWCSAARSSCCARPASASTFWKATRSRSTISTRSSASFAHRVRAPRLAKISTPGARARRLSSTSTASACRTRKKASRCARSTPSSNCSSIA